MSSFPIGGLPFADPGQIKPVSDVSIVEMVKQRSMLTILIAACTTARTAFEAADNSVDGQLLADLSTMIARTETELAKLSLRIEASLN